MFLFRVCQKKTMKHNLTQEKKSNRGTQPKQKLQAWETMVLKQNVKRGLPLVKLLCTGTYTTLKCYTSCLAQSAITRIVIVLWVTTALTTLGFCI